MVMYTYETDLEQTLAWTDEVLGTPIRVGLWMGDNNLNPNFRDGGPGLGARTLYMTEKQFVTFTLALEKMPNVEAGK